MRISVDDERCLGHTMCMVASSSLVDIDPDTGHAFAVKKAVSPGEEEAARMAEIGCPERAFIVHEN